MLLLLTGIASAAAASYAGYASMAPGPQLYGATVTHGRDPRQMALTFDDGPNDPYTFHLLDALDKYKAQATFFLIGKYARRRPDIVRTIQEAGHAIGNHTYRHPNLVFVSGARLRQELEDCHQALRDAGVPDTPRPLFRPPFGGRRPDILQGVRAQGLTTVMWSVTGFDWNAPSAQAIVSKVTRQVEARNHRQGAIVLLHDGGHRAFGADRGYTVEATRQLLERYSAEGKRFVGVPELHT